ncbi:MAG: sigma-70 family RNA polymerase sigma factor [Planctomycetota bacterium]
MTMCTTDEIVRERSDAELIREARNGDGASFEELVHRYRRRAFFAALSFMRNQEDALDIVQESFMKAFRALGDFDLRYPFYPWFHKIVKNTALSLLRKRKRRRFFSLNRVFRDGEEQEMDVPDATLDPALLTDKSQTNELLLKALSELGEKEREILFLRHFQELSYKEIAQVLQIPIGTVMSRLYHARAKLKDRVEQYL